MAEPYRSESFVMEETNRNGAAPQSDMQRPATPSGSSFTTSINGEAPITPPEIDPYYSIDETWSQYSSDTAHWLRSGLSHYCFVSRRVFRIFKFIAAATGFIGLIFFFNREQFVGLSKTPILAPSSSGGDDIAAAGFEARGHHIPPQIWQVMFTQRSKETGGYDFDESLLPYTASWLAKNPDYRYTVIGTEGANRFVRQHFGDERRVLKAHFGLRNHGPRSDLMRYLIMLAKGGVYSDTDVTCLRPVDTWIPKEWRHHVKAVVGIEGDSLGGDVVGGMMWDVQFGQWT